MVDDAAKRVAFRSLADRSGGEGVFQTVSWGPDDAELGPTVEFVARWNDGRGRIREELFDERGELRRVWVTRGNNWESASADTCRQQGREPAERVVSALPGWVLQPIRLASVLEFDSPARSAQTLIVFRGRPRREPHIDPTSIDVGGADAVYIAIDVASTSVRGLALFLDTKPYELVETMSAATFRPDEGIYQLSFESLLESDAKASIRSHPMTDDSTPPWLVY